MSKPVSFDMATLSNEAVLLLLDFYGPKVGEAVPEAGRWMRSVAVSELDRRINGGPRQIVLEPPDLLSRQRRIFKMCLAVGIRVGVDAVKHSKPGALYLVELAMFSVAALDSICTGRERTWLFAIKKLMAQTRRGFVRDGGRSR